MKISKTKERKGKKKEREKENKIWNGNGRLASSVVLILLGAVEVNILMNKLTWRVFEASPGACVCVCLSLSLCAPLRCWRMLRHSSSREK